MSIKKLPPKGSVPAPGTPGGPGAPRRPHGGQRIAGTPAPGTVPKPGTPGGPRAPRAPRGDLRCGQALAHYSRPHIPGFENAPGMRPHKPYWT